MSEPNHDIPVATEGTPKGKLRAADRLNIPSSIVHASGCAFLLSFFQPDCHQQYARLVVELDLVPSRQQHPPEATTPESLTDKLAVVQQERANHRPSPPIP